MYIALAITLMHFHKLSRPSGANVCVTRCEGLRGLGSCKGSRANMLIYKSFVNKLVKHLFNCTYMLCCTNIQRYSIPYSTTLHNTIPYPKIPCPTLPYHTIPIHTILNHTILCYTIHTCINSVHVYACSSWAGSTDIITEHP